MKNKIFYYARVSSKEQNLDRQIEAFKKLGADEREIICDKESGKNLERAGYQALKNTILRNGDTLIVKSLDRLSRNKSDIKNELQYFKENNIRLKVIDLPTTMMELPECQEWVFEMVNAILIEVLGTIAEQERETIRKRQREGIDAAKRKGKHLGRPKAELPDGYELVLSDWRSGKIRTKEAMEELGMRKSTFYRCVRTLGD
ncbi:MAG: recombinase family protein [Ruminococcaceae bacterium]|nr:recombinase family protein [Oscillospiraceae bacterium]